eukprot:363483-Chlamydomonas_euryale.AAC.4
MPYPGLSWDLTGSFPTATHSKLFEACTTYNHFRSAGLFFAGWFNCHSIAGAPTCAPAAAANENQAEAHPKSPAFHGFGKQGATPPGCANRHAIPGMADLRIPSRPKRGNASGCTLGLSRPHLPQRPPKDSSLEDHAVASVQLLCNYHAFAQ